MFLTLSHYCTLCIKLRWFVDIIWMFIAGIVVVQGYLVLGGGQAAMWSYGHGEVINAMRLVTLELLFVHLALECLFYGVVLPRVASRKVPAMTTDMWVHHLASLVAGIYCRLVRVGIGLCFAWRFMGFRSGRVEAVIQVMVAFSFIILKFIQRLFQTCFFAREVQILPSFFSLITWCWCQLQLHLRYIAGMESRLSNFLMLVLLISLEDSWLEFPRFLYNDMHMSTCISISLKSIFKNVMQRLCKWHHTPIKEMLPQLDFWFEFKIWGMEVIIGPMAMQAGPWIWTEAMRLSLTECTIAFPVSFKLVQPRCVPLCLVLNICMSFMS